MTFDQPTFPLNLTPLDILRAARRELLASHGPCQASSEWLMHMTARRLINRSEAGPELRRRLLEDVMQILGTDHLKDQPDSTESIESETPDAQSKRSTGTAETTG